MAKILFYDFWDPKQRRKILAKISNMDEIHLVENKENVLLRNNFENQIIMLNGLKYRIIHVDKKFKKNSIAKHHITNDEIRYEISVEAINN